MDKSKKTYVGWMDPGYPGSAQTEYTEPTELLGTSGILLARGWARHNVFHYDRSRVRHPKRRKEWDFYQISDGRLMVQISFANISLGGYAGATLVDLRSGQTLVAKLAAFGGGADKYVLPARGDVPNHVRFELGGAVFEADTRSDRRSLRFTMGDVEFDFVMEIAEGAENLTTVLPFAGMPDRYFMTTKQNCMPCFGTVRKGDKTWTLSADDSFCVLDWGRVCTPYRMLWYWANGSTYLTDENGLRHLFGFELTWGIGDESHATETAVFYDGKLHKLGPVDVETFPKPDRWMEPWHFVSADGRLDLTMVPSLDHHSDTNIGVMRMHSHQVHGLWSGTVVLGDGRKLQIRDMYAFCEYVENRW